MPSTVHVASPLHHADSNLPTYAADSPRSSTAAMSNSNLNHNMLDGGRSHSPSSFPPHHTPSISTSLSRTGARPVPQGKEAPFDLPAGYQESLIASGSGLNVFLALAEPMIFLEGFDRGDTSTRKTALLRGSLRVKVTKTAKIKKIYLNFRGLSQTVWPEGVPPKKQTTLDNISLMNHTWTFFSAHFATAEHSYCTDKLHLAAGALPPNANSSRPVLEELFHNKAGSTASISSISTDVKRRSIQSVGGVGGGGGGRPRSLSKSDAAAASTNTVAQHGYKIFYPGDYLYNFELPIDSKMPETIKTDSGFVKYELESIIERAGAFRPNLLGKMEVPIIRTPSETSLEHVEPIAISRTWEDQLHYDIVVSGKLFPMGARVPIAFKFTPLAKVNLHRIKVYLTEHTQLWTANRQAHKMDGTKKILLLDKKAGHRCTSAYPGSTMRVNAGGGLSYDQRLELGEMKAGEEPVDERCTNLLGDLHPDIETGPTEFEFNMQLPICSLNRFKPMGQRMHFDTTYESIEVNHWIKVVLRLSRADPNEPGKWRHFEISIDSPFHLVSCLASRSNTALPAYSEPTPAPGATAPFRRPSRDCNCEGALQDQISERDHTAQWNTNGFPAATAAANDNPITMPPEARCHGPPVPGATPDFRPIHLVRAPSFGPPPFESLSPPPPISPPPPLPESIDSVAAAGALATSINVNPRASAASAASLDPLTQTQTQTPSVVNPVTNPLSASADEPPSPTSAASAAPAATTSTAPAPPVSTEGVTSPPPDYSTIFRFSENPYEDYFARLQMAQRESEYDERHRRSSRVDVPLTPGGRVNRSMDVPREWVGVGEEEGGAGGRSSEGSGGGVRAGASRA